jgi:hypothetical protein
LKVKGDDTPISVATNGCVALCYPPEEELYRQVDVFQEVV